MGQIKVLVLDFDNCIVLDEKTRTGSEEIKEEAWFKVFHEYEQALLEPVLENIKTEIAGGKGDRRDIIERVSRHFGVVASQIHYEVEKGCRRYNEIVQDGIRKIGISETTRQALDDLAKVVPVYVNTGTPTSAAIESINNLGLGESQFRGILGRPLTKVGNLHAIIRSENLSDQKELLFVGDQQSDFVAAYEVGCCFVGMHTARNTQWDGRGAPFPIIFHLRELLPIVKNFRW